MSQNLPARFTNALTSLVLLSVLRWTDSRRALYGCAPPVFRPRWESTCASRPERRRFG